jgi:GT2 family glycosyltransferase
LDQICLAGFDDVIDEPDSPHSKRAETHPIRVSVIIPTKNRQQLLCDALTSVFRLSGPDLDLEVIVVDDASTDTTKAVAADFGVQYVGTVGHGAAASRNTGLREATGEFIAFLDDDDVWLGSHLRSHLELFSRDLTLAAVVGQVQAANAELEPFGCPWPASLPNDGYLFQSFLREYPQIGATVIRSSVVKTVGFLDESLSSDEDWDWHLRLALRHRIGFVPIPCALFRVRAAGSWDDLRWSRLAPMRQVYWRNVRRAGRHAPDAITIARTFLRHNGTFADSFLLSARMQAEARDVRATRRALARAVGASPVHVVRALIQDGATRRVALALR